MSEIEAVDPGELRTPVAYEAKATTGRDANGQKKETWVEQWRGRAAVRPLSAREVQYAGGLQSQRLHRVMVRYRPGVSEGGRFRTLDTSEFFYITGVVDQQRRRQWLVCTAQSKAD